MGTEMRLPSDPKLAGRVLQSHADTAAKKMERGAMGWLFGMSSEKPGNIAGFAFIASAIMLIIVLYAPASADLPKGEAITAFLGIMTASLGFLFGRATN